MTALDRALQAIAEQAPRIIPAAHVVHRAFAQDRASELLDAIRSMSRDLEKGLAPQADTERMTTELCALHAELYRLTMRRAT